MQEPTRTATCSRSRGTGTGLLLGGELPLGVPFPPAAWRHALVRPDYLGWQRMVRFSDHTAGGAGLASRSSLQRS